MAITRDASGSDGSNGRSFGSLWRELAEESRNLVRQEVRLARLELEEVLRTAGFGVVETAMGGVLALTGTVVLLAGVVLLIGNEWLRERYWLAALIVMAILFLSAALMAKHSMTLMLPAPLNEAVERAKHSEKE